MVLEATYLCVDNSDYMRNGDFAPSRMEAQQDAVNLLAGAKTQVCAALPSAAEPLWQLPSLPEVSSRAAPLRSPAHAASLTGGLWIAFPLGISPAAPLLRHMSPGVPRPGRQPFTDSPSLHLCPWQSNPENSVGVLSMAGRGVEVHVALTSDVGKILSLSHGIKIGEKANLMGSIQVAQLALKHRQNKNQRQRIIVFVGSPIENEEKDLVKLGKKLKKNSVAMDIINFGEEAENASKLEALLNAVNSDDNSHLVTVPPGPHVLSDILLSSPIVQGEDGGGGAAMGGGAGGAGGGGAGGEGFAEFGVDPTLDPEFAWALRVSMEEERQRQDNEAKKRAEEEAQATGDGSAPSAEGASADAPMTDAPAAAPAGELDEAALLEAAIAMSMPASTVTPAAAPPPVTPAAPAPVKPEAADAPMTDAGEDEDEAMQLALAMSMSQEGASAAAPASAPAAGDASAMFQDASFLSSVLGSLPGVDPNDPRIRAVLDSKKAEEEEKKDGK